MSSQASRIRWNSLFAFLSQVIRLLTNFLLFVGIARFYGPEAFGQFTTAHTLSTIFLLFADFGFDTLLATEIARQRERAAELAQKYFSLKIIFALCATGAMMVMPLVKTFSLETKILVEIFSLYVLFSSLNNFFFALFKGFEQFQHETKISFGTNLLLLISLCVCGLLHAPIYIIAMMFIGTRIVGVVLSVKAASRVARENIVSLSLSGWKEIWRNVVVFGLYVVFGNLFFLIDTMLLAFMKGDNEVGIYQSVFKLIVLALVLQDIATNTMTPVLSRLHRDNKDQWQRMGRLLNKTLLFVSLPIALILGVYAEQIISFVYGQKAFTGAIPILHLFAVTVVVRYGVEAYALMLTTSLRHSMRVLIVFLGTVINVLINLFLIPTYGSWGAAVASLITNLFVGISYIVASKSPLIHWTLHSRNLFILMLSLLMWGILWNYRSVSMWYISPIVVLVYSLAFYFIGYTREEWSLIFKRKENLIVV